MLSVVLRFPLGVYHAQAQDDFARPEWPPHPVRLVAALLAAAHTRGASVEAARAVLARLSAADPPVILAPRARDEVPASESDAPTDEPLVASLRGASRWAPRNHELSELKKDGVHPRDLGRKRAEVHKVGVAIGDQPVAFAWPDLELAPDELAVLEELAEDVAFLGTARSPVLATVLASADEAGIDGDAWRPVSEVSGHAIAVRVPDGTTLDQLDRWHDRRSRPTTKGGAPSKAPLVVAPRLGAMAAYRHDRDPEPAVPFDPQTWGELLVLQLVGDVIPMAQTTFAVARAARKALLDTYATAGTEGEAPPVLRGRDDEPHAAFVPLSFIADAAAGGQHADGTMKGLGVLLPHAARVADVEAQREQVVAGLVRLLGVEVRVPGVGNVVFAAPDPRRRIATLHDGRYRQVSERWTTVVPLVHSRYRTSKRPEALLAQVTAECRDVGLPAPREVELRRGPRLRGAPGRLHTAALPPSWVGPLKGPHAHLDLWFGRPVVGPVLLGRARHFGVGLCLPFAEAS